MPETESFTKHRQKRPRPNLHGLTKSLRRHQPPPPPKANVVDAAAPPRIANMGLFVNAGAWAFNM